MCHYRKARGLICDGAKLENTCRHLMPRTCLRCRRDIPRRLDRVNSPARWGAIKLRNVYRQRVAECIRIINNSNTMNVTNQFY